ncbi:dihydropteroate synthase [Alkalibaculum bacchi]|uniref:Dihydropteroate synthase n=1 Tax=Alkalibaculum bacchi TaxID=645887 RepID=A0A366I5W0_9FIRM|nr:dihydropteroate synthase [Alkalibaculum bacchi]RBP63871.1 dihydropteroate synthase [Alkalibaculum bacchi]
MRKFKYLNKVLDTSRTIICGIVNVTPDSFSDGGKWYSFQNAVNRGVQLVEEGAGMLDIGGESTRPGSSPVSWQEELDRISPVIKELKKRVDVPISIDTWKSQVAKGAIEAGADIINDITGLRGDLNMAEVVAETKAGLILMNNPVTYRPDHPSSIIFPVFGEAKMNEEELGRYQGKTIEEQMMQFFYDSIEIAKKAGIEKEHIMLDPGIGFGLTRKENLQLLNRMDLLHKDDYTAFVGVSRKRFINNLLDEAGYDMEGEESKTHVLKDEGSAALTVLAASQGIEVLRVHNVRASKPAQIVADAVRLAELDTGGDLSAYQVVNFKNHYKK